MGHVKKITAFYLCQLICMVALEFYSFCVYPANASV